MRKPRSFVILLVAMTLSLATAAADLLVVSVQTTQIRKSPQFFAASIATLKAGEKLEKVSEANGWIQVKAASGAVGWVHSSAVEISKFSLQAMNKNMKTQASAGEVALAGKGFNSQVEDSYRAKHGEANFAGVEAMLRIKVDLAQVEDFLKKGKLGAFGGAK
ncbi:MAG: SH3 domain-containing protein [Candidatus Aminicenantales bacterium]